MVRLGISVEGKTERLFVENILTPHFSQCGIYIDTPQDMKGNISIPRITSKLNILAHSYDYTTTLYDFYGFKKKASDETKQSLEQKITSGIKEELRAKVIPYIQMYEFEALLFSDKNVMIDVLNIRNNDFVTKTLQENNNDPENINNSYQTAPSKRIEKEAQYIKTTHAPLIFQKIGLQELRAQCTGFNEWVTKLEQLNNG